MIVSALLALNFLMLLVLLIGIYKSFYSVPNAMFLYASLVIYILMLLLLLIGVYQDIYPSSGIFILTAAYLMMIRGYQGFTDNRWIAPSFYYEFTVIMILLALYFK